MVEQLANYSAIIIALAMVNVVYQLEKAGKMLQLIIKFLTEAANEHDSE